jgi:dynein heavy chain
LTILSNSSKPLEVAKNLEDCFVGLKTVMFSYDEDGNPKKDAISMISQDGETIQFQKSFSCTGEVEDWLKGLEFHVSYTLKIYLNRYKDSLAGNEVIERQNWIDDKISQLALLLDAVGWTEEVNKAFEERDEGTDDAMRVCKKVLVNRLEKMIDKVIAGPQNGMDEKAWKALKIKTIAIITMQVHQRDVLTDLVQYDIKDNNSFRWQSQLRFEIGEIDENDELKTGYARVCDWIQEYKYEYYGNCERLVVTPLTDRCYITITQALSLVMGAAPQGPAGTGKTETTKDLGKALAVPVYVFNCSKQFTSFSVGQLLKGLSQSGAWGCFDEFNTIRIEVLSILAN